MRLYRALRGCSCGSRGFLEDRISFTGPLHPFIRCRCNAWQGRPPPPRTGPSPRPNPSRRGCGRCDRRGGSSLVVLTVAPSHFARWIQNPTDVFFEGRVSTLAAEFAAVGYNCRGFEDRDMPEVRRLFVTNMGPHSEQWPKDSKFYEFWWGCKCRVRFPVFVSARRFPSAQRVGSSHASRRRALAREAHASCPNLLPSRWLSCRVDSTPSPHTHRRCTHT